MAINGLDLAPQVVEGWTRKSAGDALRFGVRPEDPIVATGADYLFEGTVDYVEQLPIRSGTVERNS